MKRFGVLAALGILAIDGVSPAFGDVVLRYNQWVPRSHHTQKEMMHPFFARIAKATEGRVRIVPTAASLGSPRAQYDMVRDGVADVIFSVHSYAPARFPLAAIGLLPFNGDSAEAVSVSYWRVTQNVLNKKKDEYSDVKLLALMTSDPGHVYNRKRPIASAEDFKGLKLRVATTVTAEISKAFDVVPVIAPAPKAYEILANGVADGSYSSLSGYVSFRLYKLLPYHTRFEGGLFFSTFYIAMNKRRWNAISAQDQKAIDALGGEAFAIAARRVWDAQARKGAEIMKTSGTKIIDAKGAFLNKVQTQLRFIEKAWIKDADRLGVDGAKALEYMRAQSRAYEASKTK